MLNFPRDGFPRREDAIYSYRVNGGQAQNFTKKVPGVLAECEMTCPLFVSCHTRTLHVLNVPLTRLGVCDWVARLRFGAKVAPKKWHLYKTAWRLNRGVSTIPASTNKHVALRFVLRRLFFSTTCVHWLKRLIFNAAPNLRSARGDLSLTYHMKKMWCRRTTFLWLLLNSERAAILNETSKNIRFNISIMRKARPRGAARL